MLLEWGIAFSPVDGRPHPVSVSMIIPTAFRSSRISVKNYNILNFWIVHNELRNVQKLEISSVVTINPLSVIRVNLILVFFIINRINSGISLLTLCVLVKIVF